MRSVHLYVDSTPSLHMLFTESNKHLYVVVLERHPNLFRPVVVHANVVDVSETHLFVDGL